MEEINLPEPLGLWLLLSQHPVYNIGVAVQMYSDLGPLLILIVNNTIVPESRAVAHLVTLR
jgi:hypothetical protein